MTSALGLYLAVPLETAFLFSSATRQHCFNASLFFSVKFVFPVLVANYLKLFPSVFYLKDKIACYKLSKLTLTVVFEFLKLAHL